MEDENKIEKLFEYLKEYVETRYQLGILNVQRKLSGILSSLTSIVVLGVLIIFIFLFGSIGAAIWLGLYFQNYFIGFFYISGFYILITIITYFNRERLIKTPLINALIKKINSDDEN